MAAKMSIPEALQYVADHPDDVVAEPLEAPVWKLVSQTLFIIANSPSRTKRGSLLRATRAQKIIFNRLVGTRRPGSHPVAAKSGAIEFLDLTAGELT